MKKTFRDKAFVIGLSIACGVPLLLLWGWHRLMDGL